MFKQLWKEMIYILEKERLIKVAFKKRTYNSLLFSITVLIS